MITIVGVGHVFDLRRQIRDIIAARNPRVVGIELDRARFVALQGRDRGGDAPLVYRLLAFFQERIADKYGGRVGEEMLAAADAARESGAELALIDEDASAIFQRVWGSMSFEERVKLFFSAVAGVFVSRRRVEKELSRFQENNASYMEEFGAEFPNIKRVLIDERDAHMARAIRDLHGTRGRIVAVVGDGHVEGLRRQLADMPLEVVRLKDLRAGSVPSPPPESPGPGTSVTFSYEIPGGKSET